MLDPREGSLAVFVSYDPPKGRLRFLSRGGLRWSVSHSEDSSGNFVYLCRRGAGAEGGGELAGGPESSSGGGCDGAEGAASVGGGAGGGGPGAARASRSTAGASERGKEHGRGATTARAGGCGGDVEGGGEGEDAEGELYALD